MTDVHKIAESPTYKKLVKTRTMFGWILTFLMVWIYFGFIYLVAFRKDLMSMKLGTGVTTMSIPLGIGVIVFTVVLTGFYVSRANNEFDKLTAKIKEENK